MQSALLHSVTWFAALPRTLSVQLQSVSSAVSCQLSCCNPSALAYSVVQFICCNRPAVKHHLSYKLRAPLQSVCSVMICQLGSSLSAQSVSSAAMCQLSCNVSAQLQCVSSAAMCQLSCCMSARLKARRLSMSHGHDTWAALSAMAAHSQLRCIQPASNQ